MVTTYRWKSPEVAFLAILAEMSGCRYLLRVQAGWWLLSMNNGTVVEVNTGLADWIRRRSWQLAGTGQRRLVRRSFTMLE